MASHCYDTALHYSSDDSSYTEVTEILSIPAPQGQTTVVESKHLRSTAKTKTKIPGFIDPGNFSPTVQYNKTMHNTLLGFWKAGTTHYWRVTLADGSTAKCSAFISAFAPFPEVPEDDRLTSQMTLECTGPWTFTAAS